MPVHRRTYLYIKSDLTLGYFPFSEAQMLTILWASSLSLSFYLKVDIIMEQRSEWRHFYISFLFVAWSTTAQLLNFFCLRFPEVLFGSPEHDLHLSSITLNLLSPQFSFFIVLKCDLFVYRGN